MKKTSWTAVVVIILFQSCRQPEILTKEEVIAVIQRFDDGWKNKNAGQVASVLATGYIYFTQSGNTFNRDSILKTAASPDYQLQKANRQQYFVEIEGNTAIVNTTWNGSGVYRGETFDETQRCSLTIIKKNGEVKILSEHCTPLKPISLVHYKKIRLPGTTH